MYGGRITSEERSTLSTYIGVGIAVVLIAGGLYFFFLAQKEKKETTGFDPNRPIPSDAVLKHRLKAEEYFVVREGGTQTPFQNEFWNNERTGIYVDVITGEPLFTSLDKFDSGTGLPAFSKPISEDLLVENLDTSHDMQSTEPGRSSRGGSRCGAGQAEHQYSARAALDRRFKPRRVAVRQGFWSLDATPVGFPPSLSQ